MYFIIPFNASSFSRNVKPWAFTRLFFFTSHTPHTPSLPSPPTKPRPLPPTPLPLLSPSSPPHPPIFLALQDKICSPMWVLLADSNVLLSSMNCQSASSHSVPFRSWPFQSNHVKNISFMYVLYAITFSITFFFLFVFFVFRQQIW